MTISVIIRGTITCVIDFIVRWRRCRWMRALPVLTAMGQRALAAVCSARRMAAGTVSSLRPSLMEQYERGLQTMRRKWPDCAPSRIFRPIPTHTARSPGSASASSHFCREKRSRPSRWATRADCLDDEKVAYLQSLSDQREIWVELGLQSVHDQTAEAMNRAHSYAEFEDCVRAAEQERSSDLCASDRFLAW